MNRFFLFLPFLAITWVMVACTKPHLFDPSTLPPGVQVTGWSDAITLEPVGTPSPWALVFYPGGLVEAESYIPIMAKVAAKGHRVLIAKVPFELAVFDPLVGQKFLGRWSGVRWAGSGHSLGGAMVCQLAKRDNRIKALALLAAYPAEADRLDGSSLPVLSVSAEKDGLATPAKINDNKKFLPANTVYQTIPGGNHAQFGSYGTQNGDNPASVTADQQQNQVASLIDNFLRAIP